MLDFDRVADLLSGLTLLQYFPADDGARMELAKLVARMCSDESQVEWLVNRTIALCTEWPGPLVIRQILCSKFRPADGISAGATELFPLGPPSEAGDMRCIAERGAPELLALPPGHVASVDPELDNMIKELAVKMDMRRPKPKPKPAAEVPTNPNFKPITQADVDRAVAEVREKRARAELFGGEPSGPVQ